MRHLLRRQVVQVTKPTRTKIILTHSVILGMLAVGLSLFIVLSLFIGARSLVDFPSITEFFRALQGRSEDSILNSVVASRIPRTINAIIAGAGLAMAGCAIQGLTRNPLSDPGLLGVNHGAALCVVVAIVVGLPIMPAAIVGAFLAASLVYFLSRKQGMVGMILVGAALAAGSSSLISAMVLRANDTLDSFRVWQIGGLTRSTVEDAITIAPLVIVGAIILLFCARGLDMLALGEEMAQSLGINLRYQRIGIITGITLLCASCVALVGPIGFIGLIVPHMVRRCVGVRHYVLIPACALAGASLILLCDICGRIIAPPSEIPVGLSLALIGVPIFLYQLRRMK